MAEIKWKITHTLKDGTPIDKNHHIPLTPENIAKITRVIETAQRIRERREMGAC
ncbi:MAG: hypothetical protein ACI4P9_07855 [Selenomonadaceae bacterium]